MSSDVLIVGGGVVGLSIARRLAQSSLRVTLFDRQQPGREASWAGAGILPPAHLGDPAHPLSELTRRTHALWPDLSAELRETTGIDNGFRRCGGLRLLADPSGTPEITFRPSAPDAPAETSADWRSAGAAAEDIAADELHRKEPALSERAAAAIWVPDVWQVRNPWHLRAMLADCTRLGVDIRSDAEVLRIEVQPGRVTGVALADGTVSAPRVVVASGAWSQRLLPPEFAPITIEPVRGQIVLLRLPEPCLRSVIEYGSRYLVPREDGRVLVGSTEERAGFEKRTTAAGLDSLRRFAWGVCPQLQTAVEEQAWSGLRPYATDGTPFIGPVPGCEGLYLAAGHFRAGLHLSPLTAELIHEQIVGGKAR